MEKTAITPNIKMGFSGYKGKTIMVTGGARGIGAQIVEQFVQLDAHIAIIDVMDDQGENLADGWRQKGYNVQYFHCDVSKPVDVKNMVASVVDEFKHIDVLINNAGIFPRADFLEMDEAFWDKVLAVNLKGAYLTSQAVAPMMIEQKSGNILNIGSLHATKGQIDTTAYAVSKGGIITLTRNVAQNLSRYGIRVNCIHPGWVASDGEVARWKKVGEDLEAMERSGQSMPLGRFQTGTDLAFAAIFLASDFASQITGQMLYVDGGAQSHKA
ncbi:NAD(P)-dependent dehydrogenase (short-subunit alcohol dehydrogenase family) [Pullulanibacillus pueri]|uniref:3-oxoacyl-(ACP) reductase n=1 Tax=Pullulanibacillus pueri TaxID=1437324 RepID=A0A8J2ZS22_9BACL|nr:SDR family oxidoreductase [Pullulanibacillus pueri]MBM7679973.1 NAD(P)-dependent dehydrogenase (short-subunit alcohol dehydrogenase family) [Pullulanibacillus pueri]GGH73743.1 3-oxoacyl-(ACP) reductase [Pullulanibacillus pueri]